MQNPIIQQVVESLRGANSVLITVKNSPSVDELTAALSLTLLLNHMDKNATTVFSGQIPSTIEFLQPEMAIEQNTDSLRDFIIALDKAKADKLRYKVEDNVVRIFITPYKSSITEEDLEFSQGDLNVDVVVTLGVLSKDDFDEAIVSHGKILHDATVISINSSDVPSTVGTVNWQDGSASGVSEMIASVADSFGPEVIDNQIATALLTGIVSQTGRFKNEKTTPQVLALSSKLMAAGANQQLIAQKLDGLQPIHPADPNEKAHDLVEDLVEMPQADDVPAPVAEAPAGLTLEMIEKEVAEKEESSADDSANDEHETGDSDDSQSIVEDKPLVDDDASVPPPMNSNTDGESPLKEPSGLFGNSLHTAADDEHKKLEPLDHSGAEVGAASDSSMSKTLRDLEKSVGSPHLDADKTPDPASNIDEYMSGVAPLPSMPAIAGDDDSDDKVSDDTEHHHPAELDAPPEPTEHAPLYEAPEPENEEPKSEEPDEGSAPAVPPPLIPTGGDTPSPDGKQPVFYEADGSKNANPFSGR